MAKRMKRYMGILISLVLILAAATTALAEEQSVTVIPAQNTSSPHIWYQVFTQGAWREPVQDQYPAADGSSSPVEGIKMWLSGVEGTVSYRVYYTNGGWQAWVSDGAVAGGENTGNQIEAIQVQLGGYAGQVLDVWYNTTVNGRETLGWARTGEAAGAIGEGSVVTSMEAFLTEVNQTVGYGEALRSTLPYGFYDDNGVTRYTDVPGSIYTGWVRADGNRYYVRDNSILTGWQYIDGLKYYFDQQGRLVQDLDSVIGIQSSYVIKINKLLNCVTVYAKDGENGYIIPVKAMLCSVGDDTPLGVFHTPEKYRWRLMVNDTYTQYATRITAGQGFLIHSICYDRPDIYTMQSVGYNGLGVVRSLGCVRLTAENAKWIYDNCPIGTTVEIYEDASTPGPFDRPTITPIPEDQTWDPTDPLISQELKDQAAQQEAQAQAELEAQQKAEEERIAAEKAAAEEEARRREEIGPGYDLM